MYAGIDMEESWISVLSRARRCRQEGCNVVEGFHAFIELWVQQVSLYTNFLSRPREEGVRLSEDEKLLVVETRAAIRFGLCCCSSLDDDRDAEDKRRYRQIQLVVTEHQWHYSLTTLLSMERGDSICRIVAAKLFCNIMTGNHVLAMEVADTIRLSPSQSDIWTKIHQSTLSSSEYPGEPSKSPQLSSSWTEMIVVSARERTRESLSGVVAALYNCTLALHDDNQLWFARRIASDVILISTLLRQLISVNAVQLSVGSSSCQDEKGEAWDDATEWIFLLLSRFFHWGLLPNMYNTVGTGDSTTTTMVLPEQNVLLHCAAHEAQAFVDSNIPYKERCNPFGGNVGMEVVKESYFFLVDLVYRFHNVGSHTINDDERSIDAQLSRSAALTSLDIISISLGVDYDESHQLREYLGAATELIPTCAFLLGRLVDELTLRSVGVKARDLKLSTEEQQWMVSLVRLLGNICYNCRNNQDRIRTTLVPPLSTNTTSASGGEKEATNSTPTPTMSHSEQQQQQQEPESRNCLHVLLSCTSFATSCFTLREWGVIAIRNILRDNELNQGVVAALQAQTPVQSMALEEAGFRVKLDPNGKVGLSPLNEETTDEDSSSQNRRMDEEF